MGAGGSFLRLSGGRHTEKANTRECGENGYGPVSGSWVPTTAHVPGAAVLLERDQDRHGHGLYGVCSPGAETETNQVTTDAHGCCQQSRENEGSPRKCGVQPWA